MNISWEFSYFDMVFILIIAVLVIVFFTARYLSAKNREAENINKKEIKDKLEKIESLVEYGKEMNYKLAVIEADKLLEYVLKQLYFPGETTFEKLKMATFKYPRLKQVWWAHRVRNQVVHENNYTLKYNETKKVLSMFRFALKELGAL